MTLSREIRNRVYHFYFGVNSHGKEISCIALDGKRSTNRDVYAKTYADNSKHRVALLAVSKAVIASLSL